MWVSSISDFWQVEFQVSAKGGSPVVPLAPGENMAFTYPLLAEVMAVQFWSTHLLQTFRVIKPLAWSRWKPVQVDFWWAVFPRGMLFNVPDKELCWEVSPQSCRSYSATQWLPDHLPHEFLSENYSTLIMASWVLLVSYIPTENGCYNHGPLVVSNMFDGPW